MKNLIFALILMSSFLSASHAQDPFKNITLHKFKNGLQVILAPDPKSEFIQIKVNVGVGHVHEDEKNAGVSHLVEHVLFRNSKLKDDMSYLQIIKEKDGTANGTTSWNQTSYFATVKKADGKWILNLFHEMIMTPTMDPKHIETEKKTVLLEIGEPSPFEKAVGFDVFKKFSPTYLDTPDFWERYFDVKDEERVSRTETRLSTLKLTKKQVKAHYDKYYDPSNMQIIVSGNFDSTIVLNQLVDQWSKYPTKNIGDQRPKFNSKDPKTPFKSDDVSDRPRIKLGYLVNKFSAREKEVLLSYTEYLSHRLMKKLRNLHGETYTVHDDSNFKQDFGVISISMQTSQERFKQNLKIVREMIREEMEAGKISDQDIEEAKRLYANSFMSWSQNASGLSKMGERMLAMNQLSGLWETPQEILNNVTTKQYRLILQKFAVPEHRYEGLAHPALFFRNDYMVFSGILAICFFFFFRSILQHPFRNDQIKWVRKVKFLPLKSVEMAVGGCILLVTSHTAFAVIQITDLPFFDGFGLVGFYVKIPIWIFSIIASAQAVISFFPRKMYVMDDKLVIKSLSYYSRQIPKSKIKSIKALSVFKVMSSPRMWLPLWNSFHFYDIRFWRKGLMIELKSGKLYFFSTKDSVACVNELRGILQPEESIPKELKEAA